MSTAYDRGVANEQAIAKRLGGQRVGNTGKSTMDADLPFLAVEAKSRKTFPAWIRDALDSICRKAGREQLPVVILHHLGRRHSNDVVMMRLSDFEAHFGEIIQGEADDEGE